MPHSDDGACPLPAGPAAFDVRYVQSEMVRQHLATSLFPAAKPEQQHPPEHESDFSGPLTSLLECATPGEISATSTQMPIALLQPFADPSLFVGVSTCEIKERSVEDNTKGPLDDPLFGAGACDRGSAHATGLSPVTCVRQGPPDNPEFPNNADVATRHHSNWSPPTQGGTMQNMGKRKHFAATSSCAS